MDLCKMSIAVRCKQIYNWTIYMNSKQWQTTEPDWFVRLASTLGRFNANELRRADHEVHDIADGRYDGRIQKYQQGVSR